MAKLSPEGGWFGVRCIFRLRWADTYEERITLWWASNIDRAIEYAEEEAGQYAENCDLVYLGIAQAYRLDEEQKLGSGTEVFSLMRDSDLSPEESVSPRFLRLIGASTHGIRTQTSGWDDCRG